MNNLVLVRQKLKKEEISRKRIAYKRHYNVMPISINPTVLTRGQVGLVNFYCKLLGYTLRYSNKFRTFVIGNNGKHCFLQMYDDSHFYGVYQEHQEMIPLSYKDNLVDMNKYKGYFNKSQMKKLFGIKLLMC